MTPGTPGRGAGEDRWQSGGRAGGGARREEEGGERQGEGDRDDKEEKAAGAMSPGLRAATVKTGFSPR